MEHRRLLVVMALLVATPSPTTALTPYQIPKKAYSNDLRLVFFAGLEGAGHGAWAAAMAEACGAAGLAGQCEQASSELSTSLRLFFTATTASEFYHNQQRVLGELGSLRGPSTPPQGGRCRVVLVNLPRSEQRRALLPWLNTSRPLWSSAVQEGGERRGDRRARLQVESGHREAREPRTRKSEKKASRVPTAARPSSHFRPTTARNYDMYMSFPFATRPSIDEAQKLLHHPDLHMLAEICEVAGVDLRLVVIARKPAQLVQQAVIRKADSSSRKDLKAVLEAPAFFWEFRGLLYNSGVLLSQAIMLDPAFLLAVDTDMVSATSAQAVLHFTGMVDLATEPHTAATLASQTLASFTGSHRPPPSQLALPAVYLSMLSSPPTVASSSMEPGDAGSTFSIMHEFSSIWWLFLQRVVAAAGVNANIELPQSIHAPLLPKTWQQDSRFVFVSGLEGTGHHTLGDALLSCLEGENQWCASDCAGQESATSLIWKLAGPATSTCAQWAERQAMLAERLSIVWRKVMAPRSAKATTGRSDHRQITTGSGDHHYNNTQSPHQRSLAVDSSSQRRVSFWLNLLCEERLAGMLSYPNFPGDRKPLQFPDARMLAELSEGVGADFRVVVLTRSAFKIMMSTTVHRDFGSFMFEGRVLLDNLGVLAQQLLSLGPGFVSCIPFEDVVLRETEPLRRLAQFVGLQAEDAVKGLLNKDVKFTELQKKRQIRAATKKQERVRLMLSNTSDITNPNSKEAMSFIEIFERRQAQVLSLVCPPGTFQAPASAQWHHPTSSSSSRAGAGGV